MHISLFYEQASSLGDVMTLRGNLAAREAFNRSARPIGQRLALLGFLHSPGYRSLTYYANLGLRIPATNYGLSAPYEIANPE